jgi:hypothetical protein
MLQNFDRAISLAEPGFDARQVFFILTCEQDVLRFRPECERLFGILERDFLVAESSVSLRQCTDNFTVIWLLLQLRVEFVARSRVAGIGG